MHSETINSINNSDEENFKESPPSNFKKTSAQCIAMISPIALMITYGTSLGYSTVLIPELYKNNTEVVLSFDELTWISSMNYFLAPLGSLVAGPLLDRLGRRVLMQLGSVIFFAAWLMFYVWGSSAWALLTGFALTGIATGAVDPCTQIYACEIVELRFRGTASTAISLAITFGIFLQILVGMFLSLKAQALLNTVYPALSLILIFVIPESPHWLANKGRTKDAEKSLRWLRGWTDSINVKHEYNLLLQYSLPRSKGHNPASKSRASWRTLYLCREFLLPLALLSFCFFLSAFNGTICVMTFSVLIFEKLESPIDEYTATLFVAVLQLVAPALLMLVIHRTGKRKPTLLSLIGTGLLMIAISVYVLLKDLNIIHKTNSQSWVPMTLLFTSVFISLLGIRCTPWLFVGEVFVIEVKGVTGGALMALYSVFAALANKSYLYMLELFTLPGTFLFFALLNILGFVVLYWTLPETEGKTFAEIEKSFAKKNNKIDGSQTDSQATVF